MSQALDIVMLGLSITSSWGNGHATTYRGLIRGLAARGHRVLFLERDLPWYADNRDQPNPPGCQTAMYASFEELAHRFARRIEEADLVILGSYVPEGIRVGHWVVNSARGFTAFYDIDTPVTLSSLRQGTAEYVDEELIRRFDCYLSFTGGPTLRKIESQYGSRMARPLYCAVDVALYRPKPVRKTWALGYLGTYSDDRQSILDQLLFNPAQQLPERRFAVAGPQYPESLSWPSNVDRTSHLAPRDHPAFYAAQDFTLNVTRAAMKEAGYSPSVRLFEAGACATPVISDWWPGLDSIFAIGSEILVAETGEQVVKLLRDTPVSTRKELGAKLRARVLREHAPLARARQIESYLEEMSNYVSSYKARGHRRTRMSLGCVAAGLDAQGIEPLSSPSIGQDAIAMDTGCHLQQPVGTKPRDEAGIGKAASIATD